MKEELKLLKNCLSALNRKVMNKDCFIENLLYMNYDSCKSCKWNVMNVRNNDGNNEIRMCCVRDNNIKRILV